MIYELKDRAKAAPLFAGMEDSMIASCLQGMMDSKIYVTDPERPKSAMAHLADFAFLAGAPDRELVAEGKPRGFVILVPPRRRGRSSSRIVSRPPRGGPATPSRRTRPSTGQSLNGWRRPCRRGMRSNPSTATCTTNAWRNPCSRTGCATSLPRRRISSRAGASLF